MKFNNTHSNRPLNKVDFWHIFFPKWNNSMNPKNKIAGFCKTGVYPHDPQVIPTEFLAPSIITDRESIEKW